MQVRYYYCLNKQIQKEFIITQDNYLKNIELFYLSQGQTSIQYIFQTNIQQIFFTSYGYFEGARVIQTEQHSDGQPLCIEQIYGLRQKTFPNGSLYSLSIFLDCCYSGKMAARLKNNKPPTKEYYLQCSSGPSHNSIDINNYRGFLICSSWSHSLKDYLLKKEKNNQSSYFNRDILFACNKQIFIAEILFEVIYNRFHFLMVSLNVKILDCFDNYIFFVWIFFSRRVHLQPSLKIVRNGESLKREV